MGHFQTREGTHFVERQHLTCHLSSVGHGNAHAIIDLTASAHIFHAIDDDGSVVCAAGNLQDFATDNVSISLEKDKLR